MKASGPCWKPASNSLETSLLFHPASKSATDASGTTVSEGSALSYLVKLVVFSQIGWEGEKKVLLVFWTHGLNLFLETHVCVAVTVMRLEQSCNRHRKPVWSQTLFDKVISVQRKVKHSLLLENTQIADVGFYWTGGRDRAVVGEQVKEVNFLYIFTRFPHHLPWFYLFYWQ